MNVPMADHSPDRQRLYAFLLLAFFLIAYMFPLGARNLLVPDETRYAEIPREMMAQGDWVVPKLDGLRYFEKPVMGYWIQAGSLSLFGKNNFAVRFPSALSVGLSALLIYLLVGRMVGKETDQDQGKGFAAPAATLIFLSCFEVFGVGNTAVLDSMLSFFLTATIIPFYFATESPPGSRREKGLLVLSGLACGAAFLTKGFLAFAVPVLTLVPYLIWEKRYRDLLRMSWIPILVAVVVSLPWAVSIHLREPDFWSFFFWNEHIRRFMAADAQHKESFWFFFATAPGMFVPWTFLVPAAIPGIWDRFRIQGREGRLLRLSLCWLIVPFLFFSMSHGKLLTYILPCFPPFAILMAFGLIRGLENNRQSKLFTWGVMIGAGLFSLILLAFLYVQLFGFQGLHLYSQPWKTVMAVNGMLFFILFSIWAVKSMKVQSKILLFGLAPLFLFCAVHFLLPDKTVEAKAPGPLLERHAQDIGKDTVVISDGDTIRAVCWYLQRSDVYLLGGEDELDYGLSYPDAAGRHLDMAAAVRLITTNRGHTVLVARGKHIRHWQDRLPPPEATYDSGPDGYVIWTY